MWFNQKCLSWTWRKLNSSKFVQDQLHYCVRYFSAGVAEKCSLSKSDVCESCLFRKYRACCNGVLTAQILYFTTVTNKSIESRHRGARMKYLRNILFTYAVKIYMGAWCEVKRNDLKSAASLFTTSSLINLLLLNNWNML